MIIYLIACGTSAIEDGWNKNGLNTIKDGYVSAYSIDTDQGLVLIDAGGTKEAKSIESSLQDQGKSINDVLHIFLTHAHTDHVAGLPVFSNAQTYAMSEEHDRIEEEQELEVLHTLEDGLTIDLGDIQILPLFVPGHTPGNAVYLINEILVMGDTAMATDKGEIKPSPSFFNEDQEMSEQAIADLYERIVDEALDVSWIVFSHSGPIEGTDALERYRP
ncbi:MAG: hypothetical protein CL916_10875 [Deltaproteobacteria bacterium]|nr:hypothetical protein [Deltaproteobacteria bacterium]